VIHPFAHMTSSYAFAQRGLDAFGRPPSAGFRASADEVIAAEVIADEPEPAATEASEETPDATPEGFTRIFGEAPAGFNSVERIRWEQDLEHFKQIGVPEGFTREQIEAAAALFESWGLGEPQFYEGRYGWSARFPDSAIPDFEANPHTAITASHLVVARYQIRLAQQGEGVGERHPFVPPQVFGDAEDA